MPVLAILAIFPLMMAVLFGPPKLARTSEPVPPPPPALEDATFVASPTLAALSFDPAPADDQASAGPTADTGAAPEVSFDAQPHESLALMSSGTLPTLSAPVLAGAAPKPELPVLKPATPPPAVTSPFTSLLNLLKPPRLVMQAGGPAPINAQQIVSNAEALMGVPYVWGGNTTGGLDCSAFVSRVWGVGRRTTDTLPGVAFKISKDELLPGDILDLTIAADPEHYGHVRLFAGWANSDHSRMWVYEETPPRSVHHMIAYDARYQPLRRVNFSPGDLTAASLVNMLFGKASPAAAADVGDDSGDSSADGNGPAPFVSTPLQPHPTLEALVGAFGSDVWTPTWPDQQPAAPSHGWSWLPHVSLPWTAPAPKAAVQLAGLEIIPARQPVSSILPIPAPSSWSSSAHHWHWDGSPPPSSAPASPPASPRPSPVISAPASPTAGATSSSGSTSDGGFHRTRASSSPSPAPSAPAPVNSPAPSTSPRPSPTTASTFGGSLFDGSTFGGRPSHRSGSPAGSSAAAAASSDDAGPSASSGSGSTPASSGDASTSASPTGGGTRTTYSPRPVTSSLASPPASSAAPATSSGAPTRTISAGSAPSPAENLTGTGVTRSASLPSPSTRPSTTSTSNHPTSGSSKPASPAPSPNGNSGRSSSNSNGHRH